MHLFTSFSSFPITHTPLYNHIHTLHFSFRHFIEHLRVFSFRHFIKHFRFKMAKLGKLTKLKSAIKRLPSLTKLSRNSSSVSASSKRHEQEQELHAVYVGKSRRRYMVNSNVIQHPVIQELVDRSCGGCDDGVVVVSCEVVLFEHLLWMLDSDESETQLGSMDELVEFYSCAC